MRNSDTTSEDGSAGDGGAVRYETLMPDGDGAGGLLQTVGETDLPAVADDLPTVWGGQERIDVGDPAEATGDDAPRTLRDVVVEDVKAYYATCDSPFESVPDEEFIETRFFDFDFLDGREAVEHYWVNKPFAFVTICFDEDAAEYRYHVSEPCLDEFEEYVRSDLTKVLRNSLLYRDLDAEGERAEVFEEEATDVISEHAATVESGTLHKLLYYLLRDFIHYGKIDPLMRDAGIEDISCDGDDIPVFIYHTSFRDLQTNVVFPSGDLTSFTVRLAQRAGKQISISDPLADASLPDGSRVQLTLGSDVSTRGSNFTIRKFSEVPYTPVDLVDWNTFSVEEMAYFWLAIENNKSLLFAGGTGSGKTTSMNAVSFFVPGNSKVVSIEDTREITLPHDNWIQSVTRDTFTADGRGEVSMYSLLQSALRQRPEYLLVGEIRTEQRVALTFFHAIATGHTAYSTFHGDSVEGVLNRLRNEPLGVPEQMLEGLDVLSIQKQIYEGDDRVRRNVCITEVQTAADGSVRTHDVFSRDPSTDTHERVADSKVLREIAEERGWTQADLDRELRDRADVLRHLLAEDVRDYREVSEVLRAYGKNPEALLSAIRSDERLPAVIEEIADDAGRGRDEVDRGADGHGEAGAGRARTVDDAGDMFSVFDEASSADGGPVDGGVPADPTGADVADTAHPADATRANPDDLIDAVGGADALAEALGTDGVGPSADADGEGR